MRKPNHSAQPMPDERFRSNLQPFLTRAALNTCGRAKSKFLSFIGGHSGDAWWARTTGTNDLDHRPGPELPTADDRISGRTLTEHYD